MPEGLISSTETRTWFEEERGVPWPELAGPVPAGLTGLMALARRGWVIHFASVAGCVGAWVLE